MIRNQHTYKNNNYPKAIAIALIVTALFLSLCFFITVRIKETTNITMGGSNNYGIIISSMKADAINQAKPPRDHESSSKPMNKAAKPMQEPSFIKDNAGTIRTQHIEEAPSINKSLYQTKHAINNTKKQNSKLNMPRESKKNAVLGNGRLINHMVKLGHNRQDLLSSDYEGAAGIGNAKLSLANRRLIELPQLQDSSQSAGIVAVEIRVDRSGFVLYARAGAKGTTISDLALWRKCEKAALQARFNQMSSAPEVQVGSVLFNFKVQ